MTHTSHGHHIPGTDFPGVDVPVGQINCGGIHSCTGCASEATTKKIDDMLGGVVDRSTISMELGDVAIIHGHRFMLTGLTLEYGQQPKVIFSSPVELLKREH